jgi:hypothetical protein
MTKLEKLIAKQRKIMERMGGMSFNAEWYKNPQDVGWEDELDCRWISRCRRAGTLITPYKTLEKTACDNSTSAYCEYCKKAEEECACDDCRFCDWCDKPHHSLEKRSYCQCSELQYIQDEIEALEESK